MKGRGARRAYRLPTLRGCGKGPWKISSHSNLNLISAGSSVPELITTSRAGERARSRMNRGFIDEVGSRRVLAGASALAFSCVNKNTVSSASVICPRRGQHRRRSRSYASCKVRSQRAAGTRFAFIALVRTTLVQNCLIAGVPLGDRLIHGPNNPTGKLFGISSLPSG